LNKVHADVEPSAGATAIGLQQQEKICCELMWPSAKHWAVFKNV
jgi:hypothetical protein